MSDHPKIVHTTAMRPGTALVGAFGLGARLYEPVQPLWRRILRRKPPAAAAIDPMARVSLHLGRAATFIPDPDRPRGIRGLLARLRGR